MAYTPTRLYVGQPGTTIGTLYTVPSGKKAIVKNIVLANTAAADAKITVHFVPSGGSAGNGNKIVADYTVWANDTVVVDLSAVLEEGDSIQAVQATAGAVTVYVSGVEVS